MSFLVPGALAGLALLAAPILIHLFRPRKTRRISFSSLRWLRESSQEVSRRIEWHHWLLFLLRAGLLVMLVLALARPFFLGSAASPPRDRFIVVDQSRSMDYRSADQETPWQRASELALTAARATRPGDRTAVIAVGAAPRVDAPLSADASAAALSLRDQSPSLADTRLGAALPMIQAMAASESDSGRPLELIVFSDFHQTSISGGEIQRFVAQSKRPLHIRLVSLGISGGNGWIAKARALPPDEKGVRHLAIELGAAGDQPQSRTLRIVAPQSAAADEAEIAAMPVKLSPGKTIEVTIPFPSGETLLGGVCRLRLDPPDGLASDDTLDVVVYDAAPLKVVLIEPGEVGPDGRTAGVHLRSAFESLVASDRQSLEVIVRTPATLSPADLDGAEVVVAASLPELSAALIDRLTTRVRQGLGLALFLGPRFSPEAVSAAWHNPNQPSDSLLTHRWQSPLAEPAVPGHWSQVAWDHPILSVLGDPQLGDLSRSQFARYARVAPSSQKPPGESILAKFADGTPALLESRLGEGRVVVFNASANDAWGDLPLRRSFVPQVDRLLTHLARRIGKRSFLVGEPVSLPLPIGFAAESVRLVSPSEQVTTPRTESRAGRDWLSIPALEEQGVYRLQPTNGAIAEEVKFAAHVGPGDRNLAAIDPQALKAWWSPAQVESLTADDAVAKFAGDVAPANWTPWLLLFAALLLFAETLYGTWVTPLRGADSEATAGGSAP